MRAGGGGVGSAVGEGEAGVGSEGVGEGLGVECLLGVGSVGVGGEGNAGCESSEEILRGREEKG